MCSSATIAAILNHLSLIKLITHTHFIITYSSNAMYLKRFHYITTPTTTNINITNMISQFWPLPLASLPPQRYSVPIFFSVPHTQQCTALPSPPPQAAAISSTPSPAPREWQVTTYCRERQRFPIMVPSFYQHILQDCAINLILRPEWLEHVCILANRVCPHQLT